MKNERSTWSAMPAATYLTLFLLAFAHNAAALSVSPKSIAEAEGTVIPLKVTLSGDDWMVPTPNFINQCHSIGVNGRFVARYQVIRRGGSANFGISASNGDLHLASHGTPTGNVTILYCSPAIIKPTLVDTTLSIHLHTDNIAEPTESAELSVYRLDLSGNKTLISTPVISIFDGAPNQNNNECSSTSISKNAPAISASLASSDCDDSPRGSGHLADKFMFSGVFGKTVEIEADWGSFDGYLYLQGPDGSIEAQNDDETGDSDSRISATLGQNGPYTIWATSKEEGQTGSYQISLTSGSEPNLNNNGCSSTLISANATAISASLASSDCDDGPRGGGHLADKFTFSGTKGQAIAIEASWDSMDGYLYLMGPGGSIEAENDDDTGDSDSRISRTLDQSGTYTIWATSKEEGQTGSYQISLASESDPNQNNNACSFTPISANAAAISASLDSTDCDGGPRGSGHLAERFTFSGTTGQAIAIEASWDSMDGYLYLMGPGGSIEAENDDDTGDSDSRISHTLAHNGHYTIWATSKEAGQTGSFQISMTGESTTPLCNSRELECGIALAGEIGEESCTLGPQGPEFPAEKFTFTGEAGETLWVNADWDFDGYLLLEDPEGRIVAENDNHTGSSSSHIEYRLHEGGTYTVWASSFEPGATGSYEVSLDCDPPPGPDLAVAAPVLQETSLAPGQKLEPSALLSNVGDATADSTTLHYVISSDAVIDRSDPVVSSIPAPSLAADETSTGDATLRAPAASGEYWLGVCADRVADESSVTNNCSEGTRMIVAAQNPCTSRVLTCGGSVSASLSPQDCSRSPRGAGYLSEVLTVGVEAGDSLMVDATWSGMDGYLLVEDPSGQVVASNDDGNDQLQSALEYKAESDGTHRIWVTSFERGDTGTYELGLQCNPASAPDLVASTASVVNSDVGVAQSLNVSATVNNEGGSESAATQVSVMLSADPEISPDDTILASQSLAAITAGSNLDFAIVTEAPEEPGNYWLGICVDAVADESLTGNNCSPAGSAENVIHVSNGSACSSSSMSCAQVRSGTLGPEDCDRGPRGTGYVSDIYTFTGSAGQLVSLDAAWTGLDGYLYLEDPNGAIESENDDSGGIDRSRIDHVLKQSGTYRVWPSAHDRGSEGTYELSLECGASSGPDLLVAIPELSANTVRSNETLTVTAEVRNEGDEAAAETVLQFMLIKGLAIAPTDRLVGRSDVVALAPGATSAESMSFTVDVVPGNYRMAICVDADALEVSEADNNCTFSELLTVEENYRPIDINAGMNDAWYDPATPGQGYFINVFPDTKQVFVSWFTYDIDRPSDGAPFQLGEPGHRWLTALGTYERGVATLDIYLNEGGLFDEPQPVPTESLYGSMTLRFDDCNQGQIEFDIPSVPEQGTIPITRVASDNLRACKKLAGELDYPSSPPSVVAGNAENAVEAQLNLNPGLNDAWYNPATGGQGFSFNVFPRQGTTFLSWFTYDTEEIPANVPAQIGNPGLRWLTALGEFEGNRAEMTLYRVAGGVFISDTPAPEETEYGTVSMRFDDCNTGELEYDIPSISRQGVVPIQRLARDTIPACEQEEMSRDKDAFGVSPGDKYVLENFCGGTASWLFNWPDAPYATGYVIELWRNDALTPMTFEVKNSEFRYEKESAVPAEHLAGWKWRYKARDNASTETAAFSPFMTFDVGVCEG